MKKQFNKDSKVLNRFLTAFVLSANLLSLIFFTQSASGQSNTRSYGIGLYEKLARNAGGDLVVSGEIDRQADAFGKIEPGNIIHQISASDVAGLSDREIYNNLRGKGGSFLILKVNDDDVVFVRNTPMADFSAIPNLRNANNDSRDARNSDYDTLPAIDVNRQNYHRRNRNEFPGYRLFEIDCYLGIKMRNRQRYSTNANEIIAKLDRGAQLLVKDKSLRNNYFAIKVLGWIRILDQNGFKNVSVRNGKLIVLKNNLELLNTPQQTSASARVHLLKNAEIEELETGSERYPNLMKIAMEGFVAYRGSKKCDFLIKPVSNDDGNYGGNPSVPTIQLQHIYHRFERGDTFIKLAKKYHTCVAAIMEANKGLNPRDVEIGKTVIIPYIYPNQESCDILP